MKVRGACARINVANLCKYNVWTDFKITQPEDQQKLILPLNRDSEHLYYNQRVIIDAPVLTEPRAWHISKINRIAYNGLLNLTFAQDLFDQHNDFIETDADGNVIGMWADYHRQPIKEVQQVSFEILYAGVRPQIKVGGSSKKLTVSFSDDNTYDGSWSYTIDGVDAAALLQSEVSGNTNKIKFIGDSTYIGKTLTVKYIYLENEATLDLDIVSL